MGVGVCVRGVCMSARVRKCAYCVCVCHIHALAIDGGPMCAFIQELCTVACDVVGIKKLVEYVKICPHPTHNRHDLLGGGLSTTRSFSFSCRGTKRCREGSLPLARLHTSRTSRTVTCIISHYATLSIVLTCMLYANTRFATTTIPPTPRGT